MIAGMCSLLPYGTGVHLCKKKKSFFFSFLFCIFLYPNIDKIDWSMISTCPCLLCFFSKGSVKRTNSSEILCLMFVCMYVLYLCRD